ncbi:hypothetical protein L3556_15530 [Candidatus Synechococcus calcipolaris G9]|uniref:Uncharacterized protein n=1 Tax=Candidatus Synechococcus calcipolaris G9 TaxID=1497997 RepID=A0ABT6F3E4_9SYNE|nr:hypothetical protein [Candidatus Synechococcus calcipolaris]MDG2992330.1 hypothetical protein [Candidatus Synechococcus calcipolaris G9]
MKTFLLTPFILVGLASGGSAQAESYPPEAVQQFVSACTSAIQTQIPAIANDSSRYCGCFIDQLQAQLTYQELAAAVGDGSTTVDPKVRSVATQAAQTCMTKIMQ